LSTSTEPGTSIDTPFAPVPSSEDPRRGKEVFAPTEGPFEAPAKEFVPGPYYVGIEERMPELAERSMPAEAGVAASKGKVDRRDFMKFFSASTVAATAACVQRPIEKAIPYVNQPTDQFLGEAVWYATTCGDCSAGCGVMVRTREGRPTKVEGLPGHQVNNGRLCAVGQASLHGLWHPERGSGPRIRFGSRLEPVSWDDTFEHLSKKITEAGGKVGILVGGSTGHRHEFLKEWLANVGSSPERLYTFDSNSLFESTVAAYKLAFGVSLLPRTELGNARNIVGVGADFLDVGTSLVHDTQGYTASQAYKDGKKGRHVQFEAAFTLTGARASDRFVIPPGSETLTTLLLVKALFENKNAKGSSAARTQVQQLLDSRSDVIASGYEKVGIPRESFDQLASELLESQSVLLAGGSHSFDENATNLQLAAILANELLGAYETVLFLQKGARKPPVVPGDLQRLMADAAGLDVLFVIDQNPVFSLPASWEFGEVLKKVKSVVSIQEFPNETDDYAQYLLPNHHWLESWGDEQPYEGYWTLRQPSVRPTRDSRQAEDILLWVAATLKKPMGVADYRSYLKNKWTAVQKVVGSTESEERFFSGALRTGSVGQLGSSVVGDVSSSLSASFKYVDAGPAGLKLVAPLDFRLRDGRHAHKPVLQEAPDTLTTVTWDTFVALNPTTVSKMGFKKFDVVKVQGPAGTFEASIYPLPGLHPDVVMVPRGNGHAKGHGTIEGGNGVNPLLAIAKATDAVIGTPVTTGQAVKLTATGAVFQMAQLQKHNDIANRKDIVKKVSLAKAATKVHDTKDLDSVPDLYPKLPKMDYRWGMSIDLDKCTGCQACYVACTLENNVALVGREQILLGRHMSWIKIDRYFWGNAENPEVTLMPMLCQQCNHAPCEGVCPMYATTHDPEGINAMTYNRCIGTKYCANACPYKVRRFNWWTHRWNIVGERLQDRNPRALNPDVTVRTRGVMEKCNFCYQRIRDAKHRAKLDGRLVKDQELQPACAQTCPADAIVFGNLNDSSSKVSDNRRDYRAYLALGGDPEHGEFGLKTLPNVSYMAKVTLKEEAGAHEEHGASPHHG
jgi:Fe-S-cluster-containing dehydrogenase component/anaerobic selenocysteine-containing dehydrogenase